MEGGRPKPKKGEYKHAVKKSRKSNRQENPFSLEGVVLKLGSSVAADGSSLAYVTTIRKNDGPGGGGVRAGGQGRGGSVHQSQPCITSVVT